MSRRMKDSGVAWIGEIPETWSDALLSSILDERKNKNKGMQEDNLLSLSYGNIVRKNINTNDGLLPASFEGYNIVESGDIVLRLTDLQNDHRSLRTGLCKERGIITSAYTTLKQELNKHDSRYLHYYLHCFDLCKGFYGMGDGVRQGLSYDGIRKIPMLIPNEGEEKVIADFIDNQIGKVDTLIANQHKQIEKLKQYKQSLITEVVTKGLNPDVEMKDSGIKAWGNISENANLIQIRYVAKLNGRIGFRGYTQNDLVLEGEGAITLSPSNMKEMKMAYDKCAYLSWEKYEESPEIKIHNGDVLFVKTGSTYGKCSYVDDLPMEATINPQILVFKEIKINAKYFMYCLQTNAVKDLVECAVVGGTIPTIAQDKIGRFIIPFYSEKESEEIVSYLDENCNKIDSLIAIKQQKIEKLNQYKKSIIYEYVTGKKEA